MPGTLKVYGASISYYTGKLEGYLRYKEIPYEFVPFNRKIMSMLNRKTGTSQMPAVELPDGRFMTDTTPMIDFLESAYPEPSVIPREPVSIPEVYRVYRVQCTEWEHHEVYRVFMS